MALGGLGTPPRPGLRDGDTGRGGQGANSSHAGGWSRLAASALGRNPSHSGGTRRSEGQVRSSRGGGGGGQAWHRAYLAWKCSRRLSREATTEMLQPTREMYVSGASSSAGRGAGESCCGREGGLETTARKCLPPGCRRPATAPGPTPLPHNPHQGPGSEKSHGRHSGFPTSQLPSPTCPPSLSTHLGDPPLLPLLCTTPGWESPPSPVHRDWLRDGCVTHSRLVGLYHKNVTGRNE